MSSRRFLSFAEVWPAPEDWLNQLRSVGFDVLEDSPAWAVHWKLLKEVHSSKHQSPRSAHFCFMNKSPKLSLMPGWGLVIADIKLKGHDILRGIPHVLCEAPDAAMDWTLRQLAAEEWMGASSPIPAHVKTEVGVILGPDCQIGEGTRIETGARIGARVKIGKNCRIGAHSRIADDSVIGDNCQLTASVSIGAQGFGFVKYPGDKTRRPRFHAGRAVIGSNVRIGAFVAIDRGVFEDTVIADGCSLDNLVQIGHNSRIGQDGIICSLVGLSGSTEIGERAVLAGMVGTKDHVKIGHDVTIGAQSGVNCDISDNQTVKGYPPRPLPEALKLLVLTGRLPELFERVKKLEDPS